VHGVRPLGFWREAIAAIPTLSERIPALLEGLLERTRDPS